MTERTRSSTSAYYVAVVGIVPLQRLAYFAVGAAGFLAVATGWAIHKPAQVSWLAAIFGGFDKARVWHFWLMLIADTKLSAAPGRTLKDNDVICRFA